MTAFGGIFRTPAIEGVEGSDENGERGRIVGLDLESGVVHVQPPRRDESAGSEPSDPPAPDGPAD